MWFKYLCILSFTVVYCNRIISFKKPVKYNKNPNPALPYISRYKWKERSLPRLVEYVRPSSNYSHQHAKSIKKVVQDSISLETRKATEKSAQLRELVTEWGRDRTNDNLNSLLRFAESGLRGKVTKFYTNDLKKNETKINNTAKNITHTDRNNSNIMSKTTETIDFFKIFNVTTTTDSNQSDNSSIYSQTGILKVKPILIVFPKNETKTSKFSNKIASVTLTEDIQDDIFNSSTNFINKGVEFETRRIIGTNFKVVPPLNSKKLEHVNLMKLSAAFPDIISSKLDRVHNDVTPIKTNKIADMKKVLIREVKKKTLRKPRNVTTQTTNACISKTVIKDKERINSQIGSFDLFQANKNHDLEVAGLKSLDIENLDNHVTRLTIRNGRDLIQKRLRDRNGLNMRIRSVKKDDQLGRLGVEFIGYGSLFDVINASRAIQNHTEKPPDDEDSTDKLYEMLKNGSLSELIQKNIDTYMGVKEMILGNELKSKGPDNINKNIWNAMTADLIDLNSKTHIQKEINRPHSKRGILSNVFPKELDRVHIQRGSNPSLKPRNVKQIKTLGTVRKNHACLIEEFNKLLKRSKRKAEINDEDIPYNFLQLQPVNEVDTGNGDEHVLAEMFEQQARSEIQLEKNIAALSDEFEHKEKYGGLHVTTIKPKHTYQRKHGSGVHPYHSHVSELLWGANTTSNKFTVLDADSDKNLDYNEYNEPQSNRVQYNTDKYYDEYIHRKKHAKTSTTTRKNNPIINPIWDYIEPAMNMVSTPVTELSGNLPTPRIYTLAAKSKPTRKFNEENYNPGSSQDEIDYYKEAHESYENEMESGREDFSFSKRAPPPLQLNPRDKIVNLKTDIKKPHSKLAEKTFKVVRTDWVKVKNDKRYMKPHNSHNYHLFNSHNIDASKAQNDNKKSIVVSNNEKVVKVANMFAEKLDSSKNMYSSNIPIFSEKDDTLEYVDNSDPMPNITKVNDMLRSMDYTDLQDTPTVKSKPYSYKMTANSYHDKGKELDKTTKKIVFPKANVMNPTKTTKEEIPKPSKIFDRLPEFNSVVKKPVLAQSQAKSFGMKEDDEPEGKRLLGLNDSQLSKNRSNGRVPPLFRHRSHKADHSSGSVHKMTQQHFIDDYDDGNELEKRDTEIKNKYSGNIPEKRNQNDYNDKKQKEKHIFHDQDDDNISDDSVSRHEDNKGGNSLNEKYSVSKTTTPGDNNENASTEEEIMTHDYHGTYKNATKNHKIKIQDEYYRSETENANKYRDYVYGNEIDNNSTEVERNKGDGYNSISRMEDTSSQSNDDDSPVDSDVTETLQDNNEDIENVSITTEKIKEINNSNKSGKTKTYLHGDDEISKTNLLKETKYPRFFKLKNNMTTKHKINHSNHYYKTNNDVKSIGNRNKTDRDSVEKDLRSKREIKSQHKKPRVLCSVLKRSDEDNNSITHIKNTWGKRCHYLLILTSKEAEMGALWEYVKAGLRFLHDAHNDDAEWFLKADTHTYVIMENLRFMVDQYDYNEPLYFGRKGHDDLGSFVLSKAGLRKLVTDSRNSHKCEADLDGGIGACLSAINVTVIEPRDAHDRPLFYPFGPFDPFALHNFKHKNHQNLDIWSDYAVSFQGVDYQDMYTMDYFIYKVKPHALLRDILNKIPDKPTKAIYDWATALKYRSKFNDKVKHEVENKMNDSVKVVTDESKDFYEDKQRQLKGLF